MAPRINGQTDMGPGDPLSSLLSRCLWRWWVKSLSDPGSAAFASELLDLEHFFFPGMELT